MLSILLKNLFNKSGLKIDLPELNPDTELSLSLIESGCVFVSVGNKTALIIKSAADDLKILQQSNRIYIDFELIKRPEFPTLGAYVIFETGTGAALRFEYFFNIESSEEMELLETLVDQDNFDIILYDGAIKHLKRTTISGDKKKELASLLTGAGEKFDK
ncbi:MAG: hypothetical protein RIG61_12480 [Deltaproteobacteria bacterium]